MAAKPTGSMGHSLQWQIFSVLKQQHHQQQQDQGTSL